MKLKNKIIIILLIPFYLASFYLSLAKTNYSYTSPGGINEVEEKIKLNSDFKLSGSFNTTYVYSYDHISPLIKYYASLFTYNEVNALSTSSAYLTNEELYTYSKLAYESGINESLIMAFNAADLAISYEETSVYVNYIFKEYASTNLNIGDLIVEVNGETFTSYEEFLALVTANKEVKFTLENGETRYANFVLKDGKEVLGIAFLPNKVITSSEVAYEVIKPNGLGNSGGFMQTLEMYCILSENDLTHGLNIAGTGTIESDGSIGPIGGIREKIITAIKNDVDIFLCPSVHYEEALAIYNEFETEMQLVEVASLEEAINYLSCVA